MPRQQSLNSWAWDRALPYFRRFSFNAILQIGSQILPLFAGAVAIPIIYRNIGRAEFGVFTVALSMLGLFALLDLGLGRATVRFTARAFAAGDSDEAASLFLYSAILLGGFSLVFFLVLILSTTFMVGHWFQTTGVGQNSIRNCLYILACAVPLAGLTSVFRAVLEARDRFLTISIIQVFLGVLTYLVPLALSFITQDIRYLIAGAVACRGLAFVAFGFAAASNWHGSFPWRALDNRGKAEFRRFSFWLVISNVIGGAIVYGDRALLVKIFGLSEIAYYNIPLELLGRLMIVVNSAVTVLFPALSRAAGNKRLFEDVYVSLITLFSVLIGVVLLACSILVPFALQAWLGADFRSHSTSIVRILIVGLAFQTLNVFSLASLNARGFVKPITIMHLAEAPVYFCAIYLCGQKFGLIGVAVAWSGRLILEYLCFAGFQAAVGNATRLRRYLAGSAMAAGNMLPLLVVVLAKSHILAIAVSGVCAASSVLWALSLLRREKSSVPDSC
jgi:O-antigen/teichoic acid export membrane protein